MQRDHERKRAVGRVIFRHVDREAAAAAGLVLLVKDAGVGVGRRRQPCCEIGVVAEQGIDEEIAYRRQFRRQRIQRLLRARGVTQCLEHAEEIAIATLHEAQAFECGERCIARRFKRVLDFGEFRRPLFEPRPHRA